METHIHVIFIFKKWTQFGRHAPTILAFKTDWKLYFWIRKYEEKCASDYFIVIIIITLLPFIVRINSK